MVKMLKPLETKYDTTEKFINDNSGMKQQYPEIGY